MFCGKALNSVTRPLFHDANSKRGGVLMHAKASLTRLRGKPIDRTVGSYRSL